MNVRTLIKQYFIAKIIVYCLKKMLSVQGVVIFFSGGESRLDIDGC